MPIITDMTLNDFVLFLKQKYPKWILGSFVVSMQCIKWDV